MPYEDDDAGCMIEIVTVVGNELAEAIRAVSPFSESLAAWDNVTPSEDEEATLTSLLEAGKSLASQAANIIGLSSKLLLSEREEIERALDNWKEVQVPLGYYDQ